MAAERDIRAAKRYATALFDVAQQQNRLETIESDLRTIDGLMRQSPALRELWESRVVPAGRKRDVISQILASSIDELTLSFMRLLADKRREDILDSVILEMRRLADISRKLVRADATFAVQPTPEETTSLVQSLERRTGEHVDLTVRVDPAILGGVVVRMHDTIIDGSVRGTLERLREQLLQEA